MYSKKEIFLVLQHPCRFTANFLVRFKYVCALQNLQKGRQPQFQVAWELGSWFFIFQTIHKVNYYEGNLLTNFKYIFFPINLKIKCAVCRFDSESVA
jgi:hypothetical protein